MRRWIELWVLRRRRDALQDRVAWIREHIYSGQIALEAAEKRLNAVQAELWCVEPVQSLIDPVRADPVTTKGR